jgi:flavocytochrome c
MVQWDAQADIVIVGSGMAGLCAAIAAENAGASVLVLEKMKVVGGNTRISDGCVAAPENYLQKERGIPDSPERFYEDMLRAGLGLNHPALVKIVAESAAEAVEWTREILGVTYRDRLDRFGGHSVARSLTTRHQSGMDFIKAQRRLLRKRGVEIRTRCLLTHLQTDRHGAVTGVQIRSGHPSPDGGSGALENIYAARAVVLATGGFGSDIPFRRIQAPRLDASVDSTNHRGATADGLIAALEINAQPVQLSWIQLGPWGCADETGYGPGASFAGYSVYPEGILIDPATGQRIVNEWADRRQRCDAIFNAGHVCVGIVDADGAESDAESLQRCLGRGVVKAFGTLTDLASAFGIPDGRLETTVAQYNHAIRQGAPDPFGKPLTRGAKRLVKPPFHAVRLWPKVHYTSGGVGIDSKAQVINLRGQPIPRLFAAGEVCGGIHGASRLGSCALTECMVFGRIAGRQAAAVNPRRPNG